MRRVVPFVVSVVLLGALIVFVGLHLGEARKFAALVEDAEPAWLLLAVGLQLLTYVCAGAVWGRVAAAGGHEIPALQLARLSVEKLTVDQFVPAGGMAGNAVVVRALHRLGLPAALATEALLVDIVSFYAAFALVVAVAVAVLWLHHDVNWPVLGLVAPFAVVAAAVPLGIRWLLRHKSWRPGPALERFRPLTRAIEVLAGTAPDRVWSPRLLGAVVPLQALVFVLDGATLWAVLKSVGQPADPATAFVAVTLASIASTVTLLPGGIGTYEAGATATLSLLGVSVEAALTGTLLLRGLMLWLPLVPGLFLARGEFQHGPRNKVDRVSPALPVGDLLGALDASTAGLTSAQAAARGATHGPNEIAPRRGSTVAHELARSLLSPLPAILLAAAVASAFLGETTDAVIIATMVVLSAGTNTWQFARSERTIRRLRGLTTPTATARRDGRWSTVPRRELVPGDVVRLAAGDLVPADARLLESTDLHVQQAALTGESLPSEKRATGGGLSAAGSDAQELVFVGTSVVSGTATALVFATGASTEFGEVAARLAARPEETEFERGSRRFGTLILETVVGLVIVVMGASLVAGRGLFESALFAVALAVGLTPEYLPMITTVTLAAGAARLARQKVIVKHLASLQNLGSVDVLCSDKTGTLTSGEMALDASLDARGRTSDRPIELATWNSVHQTGVRSALDSAILARRVPGAEAWSKLGEVPFDFERRRLTVAVGRAGARLLVTKGAPESILPICTRAEAGSGVVGLDPRARRDAEALFERLSADGYRVLAVAWRDLESSERLGREGERDLVLAGFLTFADTLLPGVDLAIASLKRDGVAVKILSGDNELVTRTICDRVGLDTTRVVTGATLEGLGDDELGRLAEQADVFARLSPAQKHRLVVALKHRGHVVGFLGDGINDAPSLHAADVGISVSGAVEVAQEASDILLLERRLDVLHAGIVAGRRSFANVFKYLLMGTSSNFGNMISMAGAVFVLPFLPMTPTQILVNNFLYDLAQITIPTDHVDPAFVRQPRKWDIRLVRRFMLVIGPVSSAFDVLTFAMLLLVYGFAESSFQTGWFVESLATQVLVVFVIRTFGRPWSARPSVALTATCIGVAVFGAVLPATPLAGPLGMTPLPGTFYLYVALVVPVYLALVEVVKRRLMARFFALTGTGGSADVGRASVGP